MMDRWRDCYAPLLGRIFVGGYFVLNSIFDALRFDATASAVGAAGLSYAGGIAAFAVAFQAVFGIALVLGWQTRLVAAILAVWTILAGTLLYGDFSSALQLSLFLKSVAIAGGLMYMSAFDSGRLLISGKNSL